MSDENIAEPQAVDTPDVSRTIAQNLQSVLQDGSDYKEFRREPRINVKWHANAFVDGHHIGPCLIRTVSSKGADVYIDRNLQNVEAVDLHIHVVPHGFLNVSRVVVVSVKIVYSVYDSSKSTFRSGVSFLKFKSESDQTYFRLLTSSA
jgi:hypothetical protein